MFKKEKNSFKYFLGVMAVFALLLLTACDNDDNGGGTGNGGGDGAPEEITLVMSIWNAGVEFTSLADAFMAEHPHINIEMIDIVSANYQERIITMLAGGETLDIIPIIDMPLYVSLSELGQLKNLTDFVNNLDESAQGGVLDFLRLENGHYYAMPYRWHFFALFYNKDMFDEAGIPYPEHLTWEEYAELAAQLTSGTGAEKIYGAHLHTWWSITAGVAAAQTGNTLITDDFSFLADQYELVRQMQADESIMDFGGILAAEVGYRPRFELGHAAMMPMGAWYLGELAERAEFRWGVAPLPQIAGSGEVVSIGAPTSLGININSNHPEEALMFIEFATGPQGARIISEIGNVPALLTDEILDIYFSVDGMPQDDLTRRTFNPDRIELEIQTSPHTGEIDQILGQTHELIMVGELTIEEGILELNRRVGELLNR